MSSRGERLIPRDWRFLVTNLFMSALLMHHVTFPSVCHTLSLSLARRLSIVVTLCPVRRLNSKLVKWIGKQRGDLEQSKNSDKRSQPWEMLHLCVLLYSWSPGEQDQRHKNPKLSGQQLSTRKNFPDEVQQTVSHDKPKKRAFVSRDIAKECVMNVLAPPPPPP